MPTHCDPATQNASFTGEQLNSGSVVMSRELVRSQCKKHGGYTTEELNERLYLHRFGFRAVSNLDAYVNCTALFLSHNAISDLSPLRALVKLSALYVSSNAITCCTSLPPLPALQILDVSQNFLTDVKGIAVAAPNLETLLISRNRIARLDADGFRGFTALSTIDLSFNALADEEKTLSALSVEPLRGLLRTVVLEGNEFLRHTRSYRKRWIVHFPCLHFLDSLPVTPDDRARAAAFCRGGPAAEQEAASAIRARDIVEQRERSQYLTDLNASAKARRLANGPKTAVTTYFRDQEDESMDDVYLPDIM